MFEVKTSCVLSREGLVCIRLKEVGMSFLLLLMFIYCDKVEGLRRRRITPPQILKNGPERFCDDNNSFSNETFFRFELQFLYLVETANVFDEQNLISLENGIGFLLSQRILRCDENLWNNIDQVYSINSVDSSPTDTLNNDCK